MIKIGLIGAGFMGRMHAACYEALAGQAEFRVTAVADDDYDNAAAIAAKFGAVAYASGEQLVREADVNAVDICLPTFLHASHAIMAMDKGYDVFIEKPVCLNEEEAERLLAARDRSGSRVMVGHCIRFWPEYAFLKRTKDEGAYGRIVSAAFKRLSPRPTWGWDGWLTDGKRSGSAALDLSIHDVDFVRYLLAEPESTSSMPVLRDGCADHQFSLYRYGDAVVSIEGGWDYPPGFPFEMSYRVKFERATLVFSSATGGVDVYPAEGGHERATPDADEPRQSEAAEAGGNLSSLGGYYNELLHFLRCLSEGGDITISPLEEGIASLRLALREIAAGSGGR